MNFTRKYISVKRIMSCNKCENEKWIIDNPSIQLSFNQKTNHLKIKKGGMILLDFGRELAGGIGILCRESGNIRLRFGESVSEAINQPNQDHAIHDAELLLPKCSFYEFGSTGFRFIRIDAIDDLNIQNIVAIEFLPEARVEATFNCNDEQLNQIWKVARRTVRLCMGNYIFDGAKRDRLVWMGDLYPEIRSIMAAYGDHPLIQRSLDFVRDDTPLPKFMNNIATYSLWWIICQHAYFKKFMNYNYLKEQHNYMRSLIIQFSEYISNDGKETIPERRFLDWPNNDNFEVKHSGIQGLISWAFQCGTELASELHDFELVNLCTKKIIQLKTHIPDCSNSKTSAALQILGNLCDRRDVLLREPLSNISTFGSAFILAAFQKIGLWEPALIIIKNYYGAMIERGATSFWEDFDLSWITQSGRIDEFTQEGQLDLHADFGNYCYKGFRHSLCHGWASAPCFWLLESYDK